MSSTSVVVAAATTTATNEILPSENNVVESKIVEVKSNSNEKINDAIIIQKQFVSNIFADLEEETENKDTKKDVKSVNIDD